MASRPLDIYRSINPTIDLTLVIETDGSVAVQDT